MEVSIVYCSEAVTHLLSYVIGKKEGLSRWLYQGIYEGAEETLKLVEEYVMVGQIHLRLGDYSETIKRADE